MGEPASHRRQRDLLPFPPGLGYLGCPEVKPHVSRVCQRRTLRAHRICDATQERQDAMFSLVDEPLDLMVVIGGFNSSNTTHLQEIAITRGIRSFHIDTPDRIDVSSNTVEHMPLSEALRVDKEFLPSGPVNVGITSGASTPDRVVEEVIGKLMQLSES